MAVSLPAAPPWRDQAIAFVVGRSSASRCRTPSRSGSARAGPRRCAPPAVPARPVRPRCRSPTMRARRPSRGWCARSVLRESAIAVDVARACRQHPLQFGGVVHVGRGDLDTANQAGALVGRHVRLVAVHGLAPAVPGPARLIVAGGCSPTGSAWRPPACRCTPHALRLELTGDRLEQRTVQAASDQLARGSGRRRCAPASARARRSRRSGESWRGRPAPLQAHIGQIVPSGKQQRAEQDQRRPAGLAFRRRRDGDKRAVDLGPVDQRSDLVQRRRCPRPLAAQ